MLIDYYYYRLGCEKAKTRPLTRLRFDIAYGRYLRDQDKSIAMFADTVDKKARLRLAARWTQLAKIAKLVHRGKIISGHQDPDLVAAGYGSIARDTTERLSHPADDGPLPDAGAPGVREPRRPIAPLLVGAGARPLPLPGLPAPSYPSWMST